MLKRMLLMMLLVLGMALPQGVAFAQGPAENFVKNRFMKNVPGVGKEDDRYKQLDTGSGITYSIPAMVFTPLSGAVFFGPGAGLGAGCGGASGFFFPNSLSNRPMMIPPIHTHYNPVRTYRRAQCGGAHGRMSCGSFPRSCGR